MADLATFIKKRRDRDMTTDDAATIMLRYGGETSGAFTVSQVSARRKNSVAYEIDGSGSSVAWNAERPAELFIGHRGRPSELLLRAPAILNEEGRRATWLPGGHAEGFGDTFKALYAAVYSAVARRKPGGGYPTFARGR